MIVCAGAITMNNPDYIPDKEFVMHGSDEENSSDADYKDQEHNRNKELSQKWFPMPIIISAVGYLILNILITIFISSSTDSTGGEQISVMETRLERIEAELISLSKDIEELRSGKRTTATQNSASAKEEASIKRKQNNITPKIYIIQSGNTVSKIAKQFGLSVKQLREYNRLEPNAIIHPGQELKLVP
jgi:LysM repeat protein